MTSKLMNTQVVMGAVVVSMTLFLAALVAIPAMNSVVFAGGGGGGSHHGCDPGSNGFQNSGGRCCHEGGNKDGGCKKHRDD
jgi:hypothetical protein